MELSLAVMRLLAELTLDCLDDFNDGNDQNSQCQCDAVLRQTNGSETSEKRLLEIYTIILNADGEHNNAPNV